MIEPEYEVVWPLARTKADEMGLAERLDGLERKRIGFVWDHVFRGEEMFRLIEREIATAHPSASFVSHRAFGNVHGQDELAVIEALPGKLRAEGVDAVVVGVGA